MIRSRIISGARYRFEFLIPIYQEERYFQMKKIIVHGGAGKIPEEEKEERLGTLREAAERGLEASTPLDAVEQAVNTMEEFELFDAGYGGNLQLDGEVRTDASVMKEDLCCGAVMGLEGIEHAVSVARGVMERTPHAALQGEGANVFADRLGFEKKDLRTEKNLEKFRKLKSKVEDLDYEEKLEVLKEESGGKDTVGAVAFVNGEVAAATSTGGRAVQMKGRVGDSPLIGAGSYANSFGAVSTTGIGEDILRVSLARHALRAVEEGSRPAEAARAGIDYLAEKTGSRAGLILLDKKGRAGAFNNTRDMQYVSAEA